MSHKKPIVVVGSINMDLVAVAERIPAVGETIIGTDFQTHPGGKGANQSVAVARLGYPAHLIGRLGNDIFGHQLQEHLERAGVDLSGIAVTEGASGVAVIEVSSTGENSIVVAPGANAALTPADVARNLPLIREAGMVLTQLEIPLDTIEFLCSVCAREGVPVILDPAPAQPLPPDILTRVAWFTPNESEASFFAATTGAQQTPSILAESLLAQGCQNVILKRGAQGVYLASPGKKGELLPAFPVKAVDTTAAGDAFNGAFAVGLMLGKSTRESAVFASAIAAISVTRIGAQPSMPTMAEFESFAKEYEPA